LSSVVNPRRFNFCACLWQLRKASFQSGVEPGGVNASG